MAVKVTVIGRTEESNTVEQQSKQYVPLSSLDLKTRQKLAESVMKKEEHIQQQEQPKQQTEVEVVKSKVIIINSIKVTAEQDIDGNFTFDIQTDFADLPDGTSIEGIDITANEDIQFDENMTITRLNSIIRRCGILEKYKDHLVQDPEIFINSYELNVKKQYRYFEEFNEGIQIVEDIF